MNLNDVIQRKNIETESICGNCGRHNFPCKSNINKDVSNCKEYASVNLYFAMTKNIFFKKKRMASGKFHPNLMELANPGACYLNAATAIYNMKNKKAYYVTGILQVGIPTIIPGVFMPQKTTHAWVEIDQEKDIPEDKVFDPSFAITMDKEEYYSKMKVKHAKRFSLKEVSKRRKKGDIYPSKWNPEVAKLQKKVNIEKQKVCETYHL